MGLSNATVKLARGGKQGDPCGPGAAIPMVCLRLEAGAQVGRPPAVFRSFGRRPSRPFAFLRSRPSFPNTPVEAADLGVEGELFDDVAGVGEDGPRGLRRRSRWRGWWRGPRPSGSPG